MAEAGIRNCLLIRPVIPGGKCVPPIGLWSMREASKEYNIRVIDMMANPYLPEDHYAVIGFSLMFESQLAAYKMLLPWAQRHADAVVVGGNYGATIEGWKGDGERFFDPSFDFASSNCGKPLLHELETYWEIDQPHDVTRTKRWFPIETSRGCTGACAFCTSHSFWGAWRPRDVGKVREDLLWLKEKRGIEELLIEDDNISHDPERFLQLMKVFKDLKLWWSTPNGIYLRSIIKRPDILNAMLYSRCWRCSLPIETANEETAKRMHLGNKWITPKEAEKLTFILDYYNIEMCGFFIIGYPGETEDDVKRTLALAESLPLKESHIQIAYPIKGTALYKECEANGWLLDKEGGYTSAKINTPLLKAERVEEIRKEYLLTQRSIT